MLLGLGSFGVGKLSPGRHGRPPCARGFGSCSAVFSPHGVLVSGTLVLAVSAGDVREGYLGCGLVGAFGGVSGTNVSLAGSVSRQDNSSCW